MNDLIRYLLANLYIDFQGDLSLEQVRSMLREDGGHEARNLLEKLNQENSIDDMIITLADTLKDHIQVGISGDTIREQLQLYSDS